MAIEKVAVVTGAGRRVGNVVARMLAGAGYAVVVHYHRSAEEAERTVAELAAQGRMAVAMQADVADEDRVEGLFQRTLERFGRLDALVTAAAIWEPRPLEEVTAEDVRRHFEVNALGTFLCCRRAGLIMAGQPDGGAIVTIGDWATARPYPDYAAYFPSKGAIPTLTRSLAVELARRNPAVRVNCILPGPVMLPERMSKGERKGVAASTLVGRLGRPEDVGHAVLFLLENPFVTGVCLPVDGGRTIAARRDPLRG
ncbi:MAG TPA: SDR family oxidoreductase [Planctomycetaceae bacterium]|nr:SDR family oxidoreductase [Planctomycetaceae bacterium]